MVTEVSYDTVDQSNAISVIEAVTGLLHQHINTSIRVQTKHTASSDSTTSARMCFSGMGMFTGTARSIIASNADSSRDTLMCNLLKLLNVLVHIPVPQHPGTSRSGVPDDSTTEALPDRPSTADSSMTDSSKMSQSLSQQSVTSTANVNEEQQTDEQKTETAAAQAAAQAAAAAANPPASTSSASSSRVSRACTHYTDARNPEHTVKEVTLSDNILTRPHIMAQLLQALSHCTSTSTVAMLLAVSASGGGTSSDSLHDPAAMDPQSMGDAVFQLLCTLNRKASDVKLIVKAVHSYIQSGFHGQTSAGISKLSEPLLWFILRVLDCDRAITIFLEMGKLVQSFLRVLFLYLI